MDVLDTLKRGIELSNTKKFVALVILLLLAALGISLQMKAMVGIAPFDAFNQSIAYVVGLKVGDVVTIVQLLFVALQIIILKKETTLRILLQVIVGALLGQFVNLFYYSVFNQLLIENYVLRLSILILGSLWIPIFIGGVMVLDLVTMPLENLSMVISQKVPYSFGQVRQVFDIIFVIISLLLTVIFRVPLTIREGTIISALTFGPLLNVYMPYIKKFFQKWQLISE